MRSASCSFCALLLALMAITRPNEAMSLSDKNKSADPKPSITNSLGTKLVLIHQGEFVMGSEETRSEKPLHKVRITKGFYLAARPVTVAQFKAFVKDTSYKTEAETDGKGCEGMDLEARWFATKPEYNWRNPGFEQADDHPVVCVSWHDADAFLMWLSKKEGRTYRFPTEAEFEYAARAGTTTRFPSGDADEGLEGISNLADQSLLTKMDAKIITMNGVPKGYKTGIADWNDGYPFTAPVGKFKPNPWGLYDMNGNVWTWCGDWSSLYQSGPQDDPTGPTAPSHGQGRIARGGAWFVGPWRCRSNARMQRAPDESFSYIGIRLAVTVP